VPLQKKNQISQIHSENIGLVASKEYKKCEMQEMTLSGKKKEGPKRYTVIVSDSQNLRNTTTIKEIAASRLYKI
jgi:hypothetical protein